jgi:hypothetical protein
MKCKNCGFLFDSKPREEGQEIKKKNEKKSIIDYFNNTEAIKKTAYPIIENKILKDFLSSVNEFKEETNILTKVEEKINMNDKVLLLENHDFSFGYTCDLANFEKPIFAISYYDMKANSFILACMELTPSDDKNSHFNILRKRCISLENSDQKVKMSIKFIKSSPLFFLSFNKSIRLYLYSNNKIIKLAETKTANYINNLDAIFDDKIKLLTTDCEYNIYLYNFIDNGLHLISLYEKQFSAKITDILFLKGLTDDRNMKDNKHINFFSACSRDGNLKIFKTDSLESVYKYKTTEIWITNLAYDDSNKILFFTVNMNEKIYGIKFFVGKEPFVKKIAKTENSINIKICETKLYYITYNGKIESIKNNDIDNMFTKYKSKYKTEINPNLEINDIKFSKNIQVIRRLIAINSLDRITFLTLLIN